MPRWNVTTQQERFLNMTFPCPMTGCWLWTGAIYANGYGMFGVRTNDGKFTTETASRTSWKIHRGALRDGDFVLHMCDVRCCVNPNHLFVGTKKDNTMDMVGKRRHAYGEKQWNARLTKNDVIAIRESELGSALLAEKMGVSQGYINEIRGLRKWKLLAYVMP